MVNKYLIVQVKNSWFAIDIFDVKQIIEYKPVTRIVCMPDSMVGMINHFDSLWSVIDLKNMFFKEYTVPAGIDAMEKAKQNGNKIILMVDGKHGALVDSVATIIDVSEENIKKVELDGEEVELVHVGDYLANKLSFADIIKKLSEELSYMNNQMAV